MEYSKKKKYWKISSVLTHPGLRDMSRKSVETDVTVSLIDVPVYTHLPSSMAFFNFAFTKMQRANVCNFRQFEFRSDVSSNLLQPLSSKVWVFRKIEEADSLSVVV